MATPTPASIPASARALELVREELLALEPGALLSPNVDVAAAAFVVLGAAPEIRGYRAELVGFLGETFASSVDRLELLARAVLEAQAAYHAAPTAPARQPLSTELKRIRKVLLSEVQALVARDVVSERALRNLQGPHGHDSQCLDVVQLVSILREQSALDPHVSALGVEYLDRAEAVADALAATSGRRREWTRSAAADLRRRAFSLMASTYDDVRRMISFLRWKEGDAAEIAPSLFRGRGGRKRADSDLGRRGKGAPPPSTEPTDA